MRFQYWELLIPSQWGTMVLGHPYFDRQCALLDHLDTRESGLGHIPEGDTRAH